MNWAIVRAGFEDELYKIAEMSLAGISAETVLNYPQAEPMPSAAYEKAQAILQKVRSFHPDGAEKTSASRIRPDQYEPGPDEVLAKRKGEPGASAQAKSLGAHVLGGAGAAKFFHDWVDTGRQAYGKHPTQTVGRIFKKKVPGLPLPPNPKVKFLVMSGGATLGLGEYARKRIVKAHKAKHHPEGGTP